MQHENNRIYFRNFGIIDRIKLWVRSKLMQTQFFFVVIDTVESVIVRSLPKGIMNTYIVKAVDENHASQIILRTMPPQIANQLIHSLYVYNLDDIMYNIDLAAESGRSLPMYSFMPLNGARPPRSLNLQKRPTDKKSEVEETNTMVDNNIENANVPNEESKQEVLTETQAIPPQPKPVVNNPINPNNKRDVRSASFRQNDYEPQGKIDDTLNEEQAQIIASLGVHPQRNGADEGVNNRINGATGKNLNYTRTQGDMGPTNNLSPEQLELLKSVGADTMPGTTVTEEPGLYDDVDESPAWEPDEAINQIDGEIISEEKIAEIQEEYKQMEEETGFKVPDSKPNASNTNVSMQMGESNIDGSLKVRKSEEGLGNE